MYLTINLSSDNAAKYDVWEVASLLLILMLTAYRTWPRMKCDKNVLGPSESA